MKRKLTLFDYVAGALILIFFFGAAWLAFVNGGAP